MNITLRDLMPAVALALGLGATAAAWLSIKEFRP